MTTTIEQAREAVDESMSVLAMATTSLSHICEALLAGQDVADSGRIVVCRQSINSITWLAGHVRELTQTHIEKWDSLDALIQGKPNDPA